MNGKRSREGTKVIEGMASEGGRTKQRSLNEWQAKAGGWGTKQRSLNEWQAKAGGWGTKQRSLNEWHAKAGGWGTKQRSLNEWQAKATANLPRKRPNKLEDKSAI
ncbi:MAG: hypothetical protein ACREBR_03745 [bacterium]